MEYILLAFIVFLGWQDSLKAPKTARPAKDIVDYLLRG